MKVRRLFTEHPGMLGETYAQHCRISLSYAAPLAIAAMAAAVHAVFPFLFVTKASSTVRALNDRITRRCGSCPSGPLHRPDLFVNQPAARRAA